ncbi:MAG TPA: transporter substrate-binding domain-containing protein [Spirochaetota bacterium]|nr:transporter substrate-binding domain-containing protein [Spirochaetota bacterium]HOL55936.1 transporter substrate-binding domain-containing protein [Spirochaetota bacterium]HPP03242.1 transporter substrate-binding domain-containing protein [Spirochaetota bacterium]
MRQLKYIFFVFLFIFFNFLIFSNNKKDIKIGFYNNPPKIYKDNNGNITGYHIDIIREIAKNENWNITFIEGTWEECLTKLKKGEIDIMPDVAYSEEREKEYLFNKESVLLKWGVVYTKKDFDLENIIDLENKKIATMKGSIHTEGEKGIINLLQSFNVNASFVFTENYEKCFELLENNKVDACVVNRLFGLENEEKFNIKRTSIIFNPTHIKYAFSKSSEKAEYLIKAIDENINKFRMDKNSILYKAFDKYIKGAIKKEKKYLFNIRILILFIIACFFILSSFLFIFLANKNRSYNYAKYLKTNPSMNSIRNEIINATLLVFAIFSLPLSLFFLYQSLIIKWDNFLFLNFFTTILAIFSIFFIKKLNIILKMAILILIFFLNGIVILKIWGRIGIGALFFLTPGIVVSIMHGKKSGFIVLFLGLTITFIIGFLISTDIIKINYNFVEYSKTLSSWLFSLFIIFIFFLTLISGIEKFYEILINSVENLESTVKERTSELQESNDKLRKEIEERIKTEKELVLAKMKAEEANKIKSNFLANMTHEIRTPLNAILGYAQILKFQNDIKGESKSQIDTIIKSGEHLLELINEVLEMSKIEAGILYLNMDNFDFYEMIEEIYKLFKIKMERKGLDFNIEMDKDIPRVIFSDRIRIKQVIINLIGNAFKFTKKGYVNVRVKKNNDKLSISVTDSGIGIAKEDLEKIFLPFEQSVSGIFEGGTGLGLSISKRIAKLLEGDIYVESKVGYGSTFTFEFKYQIGDETLIKNNNYNKNIIRIKGDSKIKVLVVDDRDTNRDILVKILSPLGFDVMETKDGLTALKMIDQYKPDIILLDIVMPDISGIEVIDRLRKSNNPVKIIAIIASVMDENKNEILEKGADSFIIKPFKKEIILEEIKNLLNIEYIYEENDVKSDDHDLNLNSIKESLKNIPVEIIEKFKQELTIGDIKEIIKYNEIIEQYDKNLSKYFKKFIDDFDFNIILSLLN